MKMIILPEDLHRLVLASCDFQEMSRLLESQLRGAGFAVEADSLQKDAGALATKLWNMDEEPGPARDRRLQRARILMTRCAVHLDCFGRYLPGKNELCHSARTLLLFISNELDRLLDGEPKEKGAPRRGRPWMN